MEPVSMEPELRGKVIAALKRSALFSHLDDSLLRQVALMGKLVRCEQGRHVVTEGSPSDSFFLLLSGKVSVHVAGDDGNLLEVGRLGALDGFGEMGILLGEHRTATVVALERCLLLKMDDKVFRGLFEIPVVGLSISQALAARLRKANRPQTDARLDLRQEDDGKLQQLLKSMIEQKASDLHLSGRQHPCWRVDGDILPVPGQRTLGGEETFDLLASHHG